MTQTGNEHVILVHVKNTKPYKSGIKPTSKQIRKIDKELSESPLDKESRKIFRRLLLKYWKAWKNLARK